MILRIGQGFDVHRFAPGRPLMLGGVRIPHDYGLAGHSDADVLLHAVTDAVLGALSWGDIGQWFPDNDESFRDADSGRLFRQVWSRAVESDWSLVNCDCVIVAEAPKIGPHIASIKANIADLFAAMPDQIGVKATTMEKMGAIGRGEGMAASAVVLLQKKQEQ